MESTKIDVVLPAAGVGKRMHLDIPKQYALIGKKTVLELTVDAIFRCPSVNNIIIGVSREDEYFNELALSENPRIIRAEGGKERSDTVRLCLEHVQTSWVMVHDAARPFVHLDDLNALCSKVNSSEIGAILACRSADTLKQVVNGRIIKTVPRESIFRAYTPQLFKTDILKKALNHAVESDISITDDASAVELLGYPVDIVEGRADNIKLTTPEDLALARRLMEGQDNV